MPSRLAIADYSDRELLAKLLDAADSDGQATTRQVADAVGMESAHPLTNVGVRLGYLRKIGLLERDYETHGWYLTPVGMSFVRGRLSAAQQRALDALTEENSWLATGTIANMLRSAGSQQAILMRRQWQHGWANRANGGGR
jgi:hypothetical protein